MTAVVVVTPDELRELVRKAVRDELDASGSPATTTTALVTKQALAAQLGISVAGVDRLVRDGRIPFVRVGDVRRFDPVAVRAALEQREPLEAARTRATTEAPVRLLSRGSR